MGNKAYGSPNSESEKIVRESRNIQLSFMVAYLS